MNASARNAMASFEDFASLFQEKLFVNVAVYADETGTHDPAGIMKGASVAGVSGFLAWSDDWKNFSGEWKAVLDDYGVLAFHFSEFADKINGPNKPNWPYRGWTEDKRKEFLLRLATIAGRHTQFGVSAFFDVREYNRIIPDWFRQNSAHPYDLCLKLFFEAILDQLEARWLPSVSTQVAFFFDQTTNLDWEQSVRMMYRGAKNLRDHYNRMGTIAFSDMRNTFPLQAADMLTYRMRQVNEKLFGGDVLVAKKELDYALWQKPKSMILSYYNETSLRGLAERLEHERPQIEALYREWRERHNAK